MEIWKFPLGDGMKQEIKMPSGAEILTAQIQGGHVCLWAKVHADAPIKTRTIHVVGTGWEVPQEPMRYIGTVQQGMFVWHIFEGT